MKNQFLSKIENRTAQVAMIGLGYVGLPLAVAFAEAGFPVVGIDVDPAKVDALNAGHSYISDIPSARLQRIAGSGQRAGGGSFPIPNPQSPIPNPQSLVATTDFAALAACDAAIICVPTPLNKTRDPDVRYLLADPTIAPVFSPGTVEMTHLLENIWSSRATWKYHG